MTAWRAPLADKQRQRWIGAMKTKILIEIDTDSLQSYTDTHVAELWHVAQANPADPFKDRGAGELVEKIGREIIRRFLGSVSPELWRHQGAHYDWGARYLTAPEAKTPCLTTPRP
jgi:hypothetical protein